MPPGGTDRATRRGSNGEPEDPLGSHDTSAIAREKRLQLDTRELLGSHRWPKANWESDRSRRSWTLLFHHIVAFLRKPVNLPSADWVDRQYP